MNEYFLNRHTVRDFEDKEVSKDLLLDVIKLAVHAPTTGNMQLYSIIITTDKDKIGELAPLHFNQLAAKSAKAVLTFCADFNRFEKWCILNNAKPYYRNFQSFISALLDTTIVAQQFVTIAEKKELGTCYLGTTTYTADKIAKQLNLPEMVVPIVSIAVGYPKPYEQNAGTERLPIEAVVHYEQYNDYSDTDIDNYYSYKDKLKENIAFVEENNKQTLAQVFTDVRYNKENNELFSKLYYQFIEKVGYRF